MSMHLVGPYLNRTRVSTKKRKRKTPLKEPVVVYEKLNKNLVGSKPYSLPKVNNHANIPSKTCDVGAVCAKKEPLQYTGDVIKGIAQTHKSNAVPVTSNEQILDISNMRRTK